MKQALRTAWQEAPRLMIVASESGHVAAATDQLERALFLSLLLELKG
jgi:hypothetical protein